MAGTVALEEGKPLVEEREAAPTNSCCGCCPAPRHIDDAFVDKYLDGQLKWGYWKMPPRNPQTLEEQRMKLIDREAFPVTSVIKWETKMERGFASAKDMIDIMYHATIAPGITEKVPEHLRGVYWMKDNGVGEELVVIQWGQWYEEEGVLLVPMASFMWAWPDGIPTNAPFGGVMYGPQTTVTGARVLLGSGKPPPDKNGPGCLSFKFNRDMSYGTLQGHFNDVRDAGFSMTKFYDQCRGSRIPWIWGPSFLSAPAVPAFVAFSPWNSWTPKAVSSARAISAASGGASEPLRRSNLDLTR